MIKLIKIDLIKRCK